MTRNIKVRGNDKQSEPTDASPLQCPSTNPGWSTTPCPGSFLTGFGGHTIVIGQGVGRLRGVEFARMGMTNVVGRYPVHFHHCEEGGKASSVEDCAVHHSFYRAITIHDTMQLQVSRNTIFDITGHAVYLESGVEEFNRIEYNLAAHVHVIEGPVMMGGFHPPLPQSATIAVPADHTASGFYISNARKVAATASHTQTPYSAARLHPLLP